MDTCFYPSTPFGFASDFAFKWSYHISSLIERSDWKMKHLSYMDLAFDGRSALLQNICNVKIVVVVFEPAAALRREAMAEALWPILPK